MPDGDDLGFTGEVLGEGLESSGEPRKDPGPAGAGATPEQLVATARLAALGAMARGMAHEINNPLTSVISGLQFLAADLRELAAKLPADRVEELQSAAADALQGATRVRWLVSTLQTFARDSGRLQQLELTRVLDLAVALAASQLRNRARVVKDYRVVAPVLANEARLGHVFLSLLANAAQAIPEGRPEENEVRVSVREEGGWSEVEVRDTGAGVPELAADRIFDPFFTTRGGDGLGLGLFLSRELVAGMGGHLRFVRPPGGGSAFCVALPAVVHEP